jgi:D-methionine transport system permease protein
MMGIIPIFTVLNGIINIYRSITFIILLVAIIPLTGLIVSTSIGTGEAIVPFVFYAGPYIARLVESSLLEIDQVVLEASKALGSFVLNLMIATIGLSGHLQWQE